MNTVVVLCMAVSAILFGTIDSTVPAKCSEGTFGVDCHLLCHCKDKSLFNEGCNPYTGECLNEQAGCEDNWFGASCQMSPLSFDKMTTPPTYLEWRHSGQCPRYNTVGWKDGGVHFVVDIGNRFAIYNMSFETEPMDGKKLNVTISDDNQNWKKTLCFGVTTVVGNRASKACNFSDIGRFIRINLVGARYGDVLGFCKVHIFALPMESLRGGDPENTRAAMNSNDTRGSLKIYYPDLNTRTKSAVLVGWKIRANGPGVVYCDVFREINVTNVNRTLHLLHKTKLDFNGTGTIHTKVLLKANRKQLQPDDVIGHHSLLNSEEPYSLFGQVLDTYVGPKQRRYTVYKDVYDDELPEGKTLIAGVDRTTPLVVSGVAALVLNAYLVGELNINVYNQIGIPGTAIFPKLIIPYDGEVIGWQYKANRIGTFSVDIWRPLEANTKWRLISTTEITATRIYDNSYNSNDDPNGHLFEFNTHDFLKVQFGDMVGLHNHSDILFCMSARTRYPGFYSLNVRHSQSLVAGSTTITQPEVTRGLYILIPSLVAVVIPLMGTGTVGPKRGYTCRCKDKETDCVRDLNKLFSCFSGCEITLSPPPGAPANTSVLMPPYCQTDIPRLSSPAIYHSISGNTVTVGFQEWDWLTDVGGRPPHQYNLAYKTNDMNTWNNSNAITAMNGTNRSLSFLVARPHDYHVKVRTTVSTSLGDSYGYSPEMIYSAVDAPCPSGWFGDRCQHLCHCRYSTECNDKTGHCSPSGCADGWVKQNCSIVGVNGMWSSWSANTSCSVTCGVGDIVKTRDCTNPAPSGGGTDCPGTDARIVGATCNTTVVCPIECVPPPDVANGYIRLGSKAIYYETESILYSCKQGYQHTTGQTNRTCQHDSLWSENAPTCAVIECSSVPQINSSTHQPSHLPINFSTPLIVTCNPGYEFPGGGTKIFSCVSIDVWNHTTVPQCLDKNECDDAPSPCQAIATCTNTPGNYTCICQIGFSGDGRVCEDIDECIGSNYTCHVDASCVNDVGSFNCTCRPGLSGDGRTDCVDIDECSLARHDCHQMANCVNIPESFNCTCKSGYEGNGTSCSDVDECEDTEACHSNASCSNNEGSYACSCWDGFSGNGTNCENVNDCAISSHDCHRNAICEDTIGSFTCSCKSGYQGNGTSCVNIDECFNSSLNNCSVNAFCTDTDPSYNCTCENGYRDVNGNGFTCLDIDECAFNNANQCNQKCINEQGSYHCECYDGFKMEPDNKTCSDKNECNYATRLCHTNATCTNTPGNYTCKCQDGFSGDGRACDDIDECIGSNNSCHVNATCSNNEGSYACSCLSGFSGNGQQCDNVNECRPTMSSHDCHLHAVCEDTIGSFICTCKSGYQGNGTSCVNIDECANSSLNNCSVHAFCTDTDPSYNCTCENGYRDVNGNGFTCLDNDECASNNTNQCNQKCVNEPGSYHCECYDGFKMEPDNKTCSDKNECNDTPCHANATCTNTPGNYTCKCQVGFSGDGRACEDIDECNGSSYPCHVNAECVNDVGSFDCTCRPGLSGDGRTNCVDIDECEFATRACHQKATCLNIPESFNCTCKSGYKGNGTSCSDVDECNSHTDACHPNAFCFNNEGSYECSCLIGFSGNGLHCVNLDECTISSIDCPLNAICEDTIGSFICACKSGYQRNGTSCVKMDGCANSSLNNCSVNAFCTDTDPSYNCTCENGYRDVNGNGFTCLDIDECASNTSNECEQKCINEPGSYHCECNDGFGLVPNQTTCTAIECSSVPLIAHSTHSPTTLPFGYNAYISFTCDAGYTFIGGATQTFKCTFLNTWSPESVPVCQVAPCKPEKFGALCQHVCHCAEAGVCNALTGECGEKGCAPRWGGRNCSTDVTGYWLPWYATSSCSATCGKGRQRVARECSTSLPPVNGTGCVGKNVSAKACKGAIDCGVVEDQKENTFLRQSDSRKKEELLYITGWAVSATVISGFIMFVWWLRDTYNQETIDFNARSGREFERIIIRMAALMQGNHELLKKTLDSTHEFHPDLFEESQKLVTQMLQEGTSSLESEEKTFATLLKVAVDVAKGDTETLQENLETLKQTYHVQESETVPDVEIVIDSASEYLPASRLSLTNDLLKVENPSYSSVSRFESCKSFVDQEEKVVPTFQEDLLKAEHDEHVNISLADHPGSSPLVLEHRHLDQAIDKRFSVVELKDFAKAKQDFYLDF